jgi:hypothetical protein
MLGGSHVPAEKQCIGNENHHENGTEGSHLTFNLRTGSNISHFEKGPILMVKKIKIKTL